MAKKSKRVTLKDVASEAGVSESAASFALSGRPGVSEQTRQRILEAADKLEWVPNYGARLLAGSPAKTIGMTLAGGTKEFGSESFFMQFMAGVQNELSKTGYALLLKTVASIEEEMDLYREWNVSRRVDGMIVLDLLIEDPRPQALENLGMPAVFVGPEILGPRFASVVTSDGEVMASVAAHMLNRGHDKVAYATGPTDLKHVHERIEALTHTFEEAGGEVRVFNTDLTGRAGGETVDQLLETWDPSVIIFDNEVMAIGGMQALREAGVSVPGDISVFAWQPDKASGLLDPPLASLDTDAFETGRHASHLLLGIVQGAAARAHYAPVPKIIPRESLGPAKL